MSKADYEKSLSKLSYVPDLIIGVSYIQIGDGYTAMADDGKDALMGTLSFNLPIWIGKNSARVKHKKFSSEASKKEYLDIRNKLYYEVEDIYNKIITYYDIVSLYETALLPQTEQSFKVARKGYEAGKIDFLNWLDSERTFLKTKIAYYKAIVEHEKAIAELEKIVGEKL